MITTLVSLNPVWFKTLGEQRNQLSSVVEAEGGDHLYFELQSEMPPSARREVTLGSEIKVAKVLDPACEDKATQAIEELMDSKFVCCVKGKSFGT